MVDWQHRLFTPKVTMGAWRRGIAPNKNETESGHKNYKEFADVENHNAC